MPRTIATRLRIRYNGFQNSMHREYNLSSLVSIHFYMYTVWSLNKRREFFLDIRSTLLPGSLIYLHVVGHK